MFILKQIRVYTKSKFGGNEMTRLYTQHIEDYIKDALEKNPSVILVDVIERKGEPFYGLGVNSWNQIDDINIYVAPKNGLYTAEELNQLELIPDLEPSQKENFKQNRNGLVFGSLLFEEQVHSLYENHLRRILVRVYPDEAIIKDILEKRLPPSAEYGMSFKDLEKYQNSILEKKLGKILEVSAITAGISTLSMFLSMVGASFIDVNYGIVSDEKSILYKIFIASVYSAVGSILVAFGSGCCVAYVVNKKTKDKK